MNQKFEKIKEQIHLMKEKNPSYVEMLDFYEEILEIQENAKNLLNISPPDIKKDLLDLRKEGFPIFNKEDFVIDVKTSVNIFESICKISKNANKKMNDNVQIIEVAIKNGILNLDELLKRHYDESYIKKVAEDLKVDKAILNFFIHMSILPSININIENLKNNIDLKKWIEGYCPICGCLPRISEIKDEGKRYFLCSFCNFYWKGERLKCPFCDNRDHNKLHYFHEEGKDAYRIDLCDNCKQYIKTIDTRKLNYDPNLDLEDITTLHLDILADSRGYRRAVPTPWGI